MQLQGCMGLVSVDLAAQGCVEGFPEMAGQHLEVPGYSFSGGDGKFGILDFFWTGKASMIVAYEDCLKSVFLNYF